LTLRIELPVSLTWKIQSDITAYELARLIPLMLVPGQIMAHYLPTEPELLRHLEVNDPNKDGI
jgi:hypothetical protein